MCSTLYPNTCKRWGYISKFVLSNNTATWLFVTNPTDILSAHPTEQNRNIYRKCMPQNLAIRNPTNRTSLLQSIPLYRDFSKTFFHREYEQVYRSRALRLNCKNNFLFLSIYLAVAFTFFEEQSLTDFEKNKFIYTRIVDIMLRFCHGNAFKEFNQALQTHEILITIPK